MVSQYKNNECKYRNDRLDKRVYLYPENALRNIKIDQGHAYLDNISYPPLQLRPYSISLEDTEELDERYAFTHTLKFSVQGYASEMTLQGRYYAVVKTLDDEYFLLNPLFPCKVTYTYTLGHEESHTDFTLSTISNHPTLRVVGMEIPNDHPCEQYALDGIDRLFLNERRYSTHNGGDVYYTNDGFKEVVYDKTSATFTEEYDGSNVSHSLSFTIRLDAYKDSWHYNLLEFTDNLYSCVISTKEDKYVLCGFSLGLQPSYTVTASDGETMDYIEVTLQDKHDTSGFLSFIEDGSISPITDTLWEYTYENEGYECTSNGYAKYLLQKEVDVFGNPTGNYKCLIGYENKFSYSLNIVGTFTDVKEFHAPWLCESETACEAQLSLIFPLKMRRETCKAMTIWCDTDWTITNISNLTISPTSGSSGHRTEVNLCTMRALVGTFTLNYCGTSKEYVVNVTNGSGCLYGGNTFEITADAQYVTIPIECCVKTATESGGTLRNIQVYDDYIKVYVPQNDSGDERSFTIAITLCDSNHEEATITQSNGYTKWVSDGYECLGSTKCEKQRMYSGTSSTDIDTYTEVIRYVNCYKSSDCGGSMTIWVDTEETTCLDGKKYTVQAQMVKPTTDSDYIFTGNKRIGSETSDSPAECSGTTSYENWRETESYRCNGTSKYKELRLYVSNDNETWIETDIYKDGDLIEQNSTDCGYVAPSAETITKWMVIGTICNGYSLYNQERKYTSTDNGSTWTPTDVYRRGGLVEENSTDCGYTPPIQYEYRWVLTDNVMCGENGSVSAYTS